MNDADYWTIKAMIAFGGSFASHLGKAAQFADDTNLRKIKETWGLYWSSYETMGLRLKAENDKRLELLMDVKD